VIVFQPGDACLLMQFSQVEGAAGGGGQVGRRVKVSNRRTDTSAANVQRKSALPGKNLLPDRTSGDSVSMMMQSKSKSNALIIGYPLYLTGIQPLR